ncbi:MAG: hypothetical protein J7M21_03130, partial [Planctomycetes bacterium]|nr:hypothetical protein [Planctomycetota bacterium]
MNARILATVLAGLLCGPGVAVEAGTAPPLAERLPGDCLAYAGWAGRSLAFDGSTFGQLLADPAVAKVMGSLKAAILADVHGPRDRAAVEHLWQMGRIAWQHPIAAALIDLKAQPRPSADAVLLVDLGEDREEFAGHLEAVLASMKDELAFKDATIGTVAPKVFRPKDGPQVSYGYLGNVLFVAVGDAAAGRVIGLAPSGSLASAKSKFSRCMKALGGEGVQAAYYVDS